MKPYYADSWLTVYGGDCRTVLQSLEAESVHTVITSPPYWGLRDYGTATWEGGEEGCDHRHDTEHQKQGATSQRNGRANVEEQRNENFRGVCPSCGARRIDSQLGLEQTPEEYVTALVDVFREVRRVLRSDGTVWLNLGDSYFSQGGHTGQGSTSQRQGRSNVAAQNHDNGRSGGKVKDLVGVPWRVAFALQADGWYLRSDIIWSKPNPMPESVTDRPTKSHEYLFLLAKSARYFFDADAVREPMAEASEARYGYAFGGAKAERLTAEEADGPGTRTHPIGFREDAAGRNIRSVWTIATAPYPGAHFATFPPKLVEPCVKAGCPSDGVVLDPFAGTGTVGMVAQSLSRRAVLIDLNPDYLRQCLERNRDIPLGLMEGRTA